jgi:hypothetical protein
MDVAACHPSPRQSIAHRAAQEIVMTEPAGPVARPDGLETVRLLERLIAEGVIGPSARTERPVATERRRIRARGSLADLIGEQRD